MRARVAIASNALASAGLSPSVVNLIHRTLLEGINAHARLVFEGDADVTDFIRAIRSDGSLPQGARTLWIETLARLRKQQRITIRHDEGMALASIGSLDELRANWGAHSDVAIVAEAACGVLGIPFEEGFLAEPDFVPDVAISTAASASPAIARFARMAQSPIAHVDSSREDFWSDVLAPLAADARHATILDGYLFGSTLNISTGHPSARRWKGEHVSWLLSRLDDVMAPGAEVRLIGRWQPKDPKTDARTVADSVRTQWKPPSLGRLGRVTVVLAAPPKGERFPHDRHIRFASGGAITLAAGFDRLREPRIKDPDGMKWGYLWQPDALRALQDSEARAASFADDDALARVLDR